MTIYPNQLIAQLQKKLLPIYIVYGEELVQRHTSIATITKTAMTLGYGERICLRDQKTQSLPNLRHHIANDSFWGERSLVEWRQPILNWSKPVQDFLETHIADFSDTVCLILVVEQLNPYARWKALPKTLSAHIEIIPCNELPLPQLPRWIDAQLNAEGLSMEPSDVQLLAECVEGNMLEAQQILKKLKIRYGAKRLHHSEIQPLLADHSRFHVFSLIDHILHGNLPKSEHMLQRMQQANVDPKVVVGILSRLFAGLSRMAHLILQEAALTELYREYRLWEKQQMLWRSALRRYPEPTYWLLCLQRLGHIDAINKGAAPGNPWVALTALLRNM